MRSVLTVLGLLLLTVAVYLAITNSAMDRTWDVVLMGLPTSLTPKDIEVTSVGYLINQTHKPLFKRNEDGQYSSEVLSTWSQDRSGKNVRLCPKDNIIIGKSVPFDAKGLHQFLEIRLQELGLKAELFVKDNCLNILFDRFDHNFFEQFTKFENAPTWKLSGDSLESGLGAFYIDIVESDRWELLRKSDSRSGFNKIVVHGYRDKGHLEQLTQNEEIEDINRVSPDLVPDKLKKQYADYGVVLLQTAVLIINIKDPLVRREIYNCVDIEKFRRAFSPGQHHFKNIQTILPIGAPGALEGLPPQNCTSRKLSKKTVVKFWNWKDNNRESLKIFWNEFNSLATVEVRYADIPLNQLMEIVSRKETQHELIVVGLSATEFHYRDFYQYIVHPKHSILSNVKMDLSQDLLKLDSSPTEKEVADGVRKLDKFVSEEGVALPIFQQVRHFYFPKRIKGLKFGSNFLEHPVIEEILN